LSYLDVSEPSAHSIDESEKASGESKEQISVMV